MLKGCHLANVSMCSVVALRGKLVRDYTLEHLVLATILLLIYKRCILLQTLVLDHQVLMTRIKNIGWLMNLHK